MINQDFVQWSSSSSDNTIESQGAWKLVPLATFWRRTFRRLAIPRMDVETQAVFLYIYRGSKICSIQKYFQKYCAHIIFNFTWLWRGSQLNYIYIMFVFLHGGSVNLNFGLQVQHQSMYWSLCQWRLITMRLNSWCPQRNIFTPKTWKLCFLMRDLVDMWEIHRMRLGNPRRPYAMRLVVLKLLHIYICQYIIW